MKNKQILYRFGRPFSPFYSLLMRFRTRLYRLGVLRVHRVDVPVVSVGNLTMGGSGKTPLVQYIAGFLHAKGFRPAVISRGYGGAAGNPVNVVSNGKQVLLDAVAAGDEPRLLADTLPGVPVLTGRKRKYPAAMALELGADVLVLDDAFQHLAMGRDLDFVLFNADFLAGNSVVFPGGDLREPVKALNRCHGFILTGVCERNKERAEKFSGLLRKHFPDHPVFMARYRPVSVLAPEKGGEVKPLPLETLDHLPLFGFCGIAHPQNFRDTLNDMGLDMKGFRPFADHHLYSPDDLKAIFHQASSLGVEACITTEKDLVKLSATDNHEMMVYALRMQVEIDDGFNEFLLAGLQS